MAKGTHANYSDEYLKEHPMPELDALAVERLTKMLVITKHGLTLRGHSYIYNARYLFLKGYLKLNRVDDLREDRAYRKSSEIDLEDSESICTYDDLASVHITPDLKIEIHVDEAIESFRTIPSCRRAVFHLTGDWWRIWHYDTTVEKRLQEKFSDYAENCRLAEEIAQQIMRRTEIEGQLLAGTYQQENEDDA